MPNHLACFSRCLLTCKSPLIPFLPPRLLTPRPAPPKLWLPPTQAQKRGIAVGQQAQEAQVEAGDATDQSIRHAITESTPGDARMHRKRPSAKRPSTKGPPTLPRQYSVRRPRFAEILIRDARRRRHRLRSIYQSLQLSHSRTDFVSLGSRGGRVSSSFSTEWNLRYVKLVKRFNKDLRQSGSLEGRGLSIAERPIKNPWARQVAAAAAVDINKFKTVWKNLHWGIKSVTWPIVMHWALSYYPERALAILFTTLSKPDYKPPPFAVADSLDHLACVFLMDNLQPDPKVLQRIRRLVSFHLESSNAQNDNFRGVRQRTLYLLSQRCRGLQQLRLYETIRACNTFVHYNTLLHLMSSFVDIGELVTAMEILERIVKTGADLKLNQIQMGCAKLLRGGSDLEDSHRIRYKVRSNILAQMLELGIPPNLMMYNVIILNAVEAGQMKFAWRIYAMLKTSKFEPDALTYSILLKGIKHGMDEIQVSKLLQRAKDAGLLAKSPYLVCQLLHITYLYRPNHEEFPAFTELVPIYEQYVDNQPLKDLGLLRHHTDMPSQSEVELMQPPPPILGIMIAAYLMQHSDSDHIRALYARYRELVEAGHPLIAPLAETTFTSNAFLKALGRHSENLPLCTTILEHMLKGPAGATPTVQTWSILLASFMAHRQVTAGEKVLTMMRDRGLKPNQVTWNTLLGGYASMQDVEGTIKVMRRMEEGGYVVEQETLKAWGKVVDRRRLVQAFERAVMEDEQASSEHDTVDHEDEGEQARSEHDTVDHENEGEQTSSEHDTVDHEDEGELAGANTGLLGTER